MEGDALPNNWRWSTLGEIADPTSRAIVSGPFGSNIGSRFFVAEGVPVIRGNNLTSDMTRFVDDGFVFVTEDKADELRNCDAIIDDLVFTAAGSLGQVGIIPRTAKYHRYIISNKQLRARVDKRKVDPLFAFYWFASKEMVEYVQQRNTGSSVPLINLSVLRSLPLPLPPLTEQRAITRILGMLDDKIELNRKMNQTLEAMAQVIFKSWFVDFDPVRAKAEGRDLGLPPDLAALFPDSFEDSELGEIPKGWRAGSLAALVDIQGGTQPPASEFLSAPQEGYVRLIQIRDYESDSHLTFIPDTAKLRKCFRDDVMIARYGASVARICWGLEGAYNVALVKAAPKKTSYREYLRSYLASHDFQARLIGMSNRSVQAGFNKGDISSFDIVIPSERIFSIYHDVAWALRSRILQNRDESRTLAALRDTLLPKLLSGEIRMKDEKEALL